MANNILIIPGDAKIELSGASASTTELQVAANGDVEFVGTTDGLLLSISEASDLIRLLKPTKVEDQLYLGSGSITASGNLLNTGTGIATGLTWYNNTGTVKRIWNDDSDDSLNITMGDTKNNGFRLASDGEGYLGGNRILTTADSGGGSGLNADTLDGYDSSAFPRLAVANTFTAGMTIEAASAHITLVETDAALNAKNWTIHANGATFQIQSRTDAGVFVSNILEIDRSGNISTMSGANTVWTSANDGTGSGLDADLLDGYEAAAFPRKDEDATITGNWTFSGTTTIINSNQVDIGDNILVLNSDETGAPSQDAGFEVERGTSANVSWLWDETNDYFTPGGQLIGNIGDPTLGTHVGDRDYNDDRYIERTSQGSDITATKVFANATSLYFRASGGSANARIVRDGSDNLLMETNGPMLFKSTSDGLINFRNNANSNIFQIDTSGSNTVYVSGNRVLTTADEGSGNGIDADTLDGQEGAYYLSASSYTAADVLAKLLTVDGSGSGLDADLLDGLSSAQFLRSDTNTDFDSDNWFYFGLNTEGGLALRHDTATNRTLFRPYDGAIYDGTKDFLFDADDGHWTFADRLDVDGVMNIGGNVTLSGTLSNPTDPTLGTHVGDRDYNDGRYGRLASQNEWDADQTFSGGPAALKLKTDGSNDHVYVEFYTRDSDINTRSAYFGYAATATNHLSLVNQITNGDIRLSATGTGVLTFNGNRVLTVADEGAGNGLDADTLDSIQSTQFLRTDTADGIDTGVNFTIGSGEGHIIFFHSAPNNRFYMAPYDGGSYDYGKEFSFDADLGYWEFDDRLDVGGALNVGTTAHIDDEVQTEKVSIDDTSDNKKFEIVYNATSDSLDFNFVG